MKHSKSTVEAFELFTRMMNEPALFSQIFGGDFSGKPLKKPLYESLGEGYELRPIEILAEGGQIVIENDRGYSHLYHNGLQISNQVFRAGGTNNGFQEGFCLLIAYEKNPSDKKYGFDFGTHVIINRLGEIVLRGNKYSNYPSHCGGNIGRLNNTYYNLLTGEEILTADITKTLSSKNYIFVEHRYDWYNKELPIGLYQIDKETGKFWFVDHVK